MMQHIKIGEGQVLVDVAMQHCGDLDGLFELCMLNDISLTDEIDVATVLVTPEPGIEAAELVQLFSRLNLIPASDQPEIDDVLVVDSVRDFVLMIDVKEQKGLALVNNLQCFIDFAIQELADVERVFELCILNDLPLTEMLLQGTDIRVPDYELSKKRQVLFFKNKMIVSRDDDDGLPGTLPPGGIGFMQVAASFMAS